MERVSLECCWRRWREWIARKNDLHGGFKMGRRDCRESRCCFHLWQGPLWNEQANPGEMEMEHLDTTFSPSSQEHQKALYLGVKLQVRQQKKRKLRRTMEKSLVLPLHYVPGVEEAEVWLRMECSRATRPQYGVNFREKLSAKYVVFHSRPGTSRSCARPWRG